MRDIVVDLETVRDPENPPAATSDDRVPAAPHHRIIVGGALMLDEQLVLRGIRSFTNERECAISLARTLNDGRSRLVTFNGRRFDLPVLGAACLRHGVPFPRYFDGGKTGLRYRYSDRPHIDLADWISDYGAAVPWSMSAATRLFGLPGKRDVNGSDVATLAAAGEIDKIIAYNLEDLLSTTLLHLRRLLVCEMISAADYKVVTAGIIDAAVKERPSLSAFVDETDMDRLLQVYEPATSEA